jgi:RHS repeat-associated protein
MARFGFALFPSFNPSRNQRFPMLFCRFALAFALSAMFLQSVAHAQSPPTITPDDQMGFMPYVSYHGGDIDHVNIATGNLVVNLPFLSYPQRGNSLKAQFDLMYNGHPLQVQNVCAPPAPCQWLWVTAGFVYPWAGNAPSPSVGVNVVDSDHVTIAQSSTKITVCGTCDPLQYAYQTLFKLMTADNASHVLGLLPSTGGNCGTSVAEFPYVWYSDWGTFQTLDATGWQVVIPEPSQTQCGFEPPAPTLISPEGVRHLSGDTVREDPNGNEITINTSAGTMADTLGRTIPMPPTSQSSSNASTSLCPAASPLLPAVSAAYWTPPGYNGASVQYLFCYASVPVNIAKNTNNGVNGYSGTITMLQSITLPNATSWLFYYSDSDTAGNQYGSLSQITFPTGGTISYTYVTGGNITDLASRWVASRTVNANDGTGPHKWTYSYGQPTIVTDPPNNVTAHTWGAASGACTSSCWPYEVLTQYYQGSQSGTLLKTVATAYQFAGTGSNMPEFAIPEVPVSTTVTWPGNQVTETLKAYDSGFTYLGDYDQGAAGYTGIYGKVVAQTDYDYGSGAKGSPLRTTNTSYVWQSPNPNYSGYLSNNLLNLPYSVKVLNGGGTQMAFTYYGYDVGALVTTGASLTGEVAYPGNQTSINRLESGSTTATTNCSVSVSNGYLVTSRVYYNTGEVQKSTDPCGYKTTYQYGSSNTGALPTTITNNLSQITTYAYDSNTGALTSVTDPNSQITTKNYDILTRPTQINYPDGGQTTVCYTDMGGSTCSEAGTPYKVVVTKAITSSLNETSTTVVDGLGRPSQTQLNSDPSGIDYMLTTYDAVGRKSQVYNPTRCSPITTNCGESTWGYTTNNYDALNRVTSVTEQDNSIVQTAYDQTCSLNTNTLGTLVTDEAGNQRRSCTDGLGRLVEVDEPGNDGGTGEPATGSVTFSGTEQNPVSTCPGGCYVWDDGAFNVAVNGVAAPQVFYSESSTASSLASSLATSINQTSNYPVTAQPSGDMVTLTATTDGTVGNTYSLSASLAGHDTEWFSTPSFSISSSGSSLTGGSSYGLVLSLATPFVTLYNYDALGNLLCVEQHGNATSGTGCSSPSSDDASSPWRVRRFSYDSLSNLLASENPETGGLAGTISYAYDADSNLVSKKTPSPNQTSTYTATTSYTYDGLNRLIGKSYTDTDTSNNALNFPVKYGYDGLALTGCTAAAPPGLTDTYPIGRRTAMCDGSGGTSWLHDKMGRVLTERRTIGAAVGLYLYYTYNVDGSLATLRTPPQKTITYTMGGAGLPLSAVDTGDGVNFVTGATYAAPGELQSLTAGAAIYGALSYNSRLQPLQIFYGTNSPPAITGSTCPSTVGNIMHRVYNFSLGSGDNGNVASIANCLNTTRTQNFGYDALNRILFAESSGTQWGESFAIDAWSNLYARNGLSGKTNYESLSVTATTLNQLTGFGYDAIGNMTSNTGTSYVYDDENRLVWTSGERYLYDADGKRVEKCAASTLTTACPTSGTTGTLYWRGTGSDTLDESDLAGNALEDYVFFNGVRIARRDVSTDTAHYYFSDHLGTHAVVQNAAGTACEQDVDYYPYGGQQNDYCTTPVAQHYKFTGKERDSESGLDNFGARYLGSSLGRFMSPDPMGGQQDDPQSLNRYAYVRNNPLKLTDPTGLNFNLSCTGPDTATCQGGLQGTTTTTTDANGNQTSTFAATEISNDKNGNLVDQNGNQYSGTFDGTNVSFNQNGSTQSSTGVWKEGSDPTSGITGGGALDDSFHFTFEQHGAGQKLNAFGYHVGSPEDAIRKLGAAGIRFSMLDTIFNLREMVDHPGAVNFRSSGDPGTGANSTHLLLDRTPSATVPWAQTFNLHTGETNPWENLGAAWQHAVNEQ